ncbi:hypothetical protein OM416_27145 [Paenibacillus sp. LS1]|uniref:hypothetical protein n=1 Tax=Paenibacillus sp. LS1 TaxID=2992120 RepID=UPI002231A4F7|nr:hypothetical protein [Paenibacillus sp. LS1]MCW3795287.1 hypothetical protein [Paenibacillus sp. LS1]
MLEFSFEIIDEANINIQYKYGSQFFHFNLFWSNGDWTLHPFEGILIENREMCSLIIADLLKNKDFHVMLAKEKIVLSRLRTTVNLQPDDPEEFEVSPRIDDRSSQGDELMGYIENHSFEEVLELEQQQMQAKVDFFQEIIQRMFMEGIGPEDPDFRKVQSIIRIYKDTFDRLGNINDNPMGDYNNKRW